MKEFVDGRYRSLTENLSIRVLMSEDGRFLGIETWNSKEQRTRVDSYICTTMPPIEIVREAVPR